MKAETVLLHGLSIACLLACALCLAGMVRSQGPAPEFAKVPAPVVQANV